MQTNVSITKMLTFSVLCLFLFPAVAHAVPRAVTLFPNSARVTDVTRISPQTTGQGSFKAVVNLPAQALPDSLTARLDLNSPLKIEDQSWRQINRQDEGRIADLRNKLRQAKTERNGVVSAIQSLEAQLRFWQAQSKAKARTAEETVVLAEQIGKSVKKNMQEKLALEPEMERLDKKIRELQEEITRIAGQKETLWEMTLILSGSPVREADLTMTYTLNGCGWLPHYRLDARPREGRVLFTWDAEIWQSSGSDWNQIDAELATLQPRSALGPPDLPPWIIRPHPEVRLNKGRQKADAMAAPMAGASLYAEAQDAAEPREARQTTYAVWTLGKKTIPAGSHQRLKIREEAWQADFVHLLRPSLTSQAFIRASVKLPEGSEAPSGAATFLIDGAVLGTRPFSFAGQEGTFSFGIDPLVTAQSVLLSRKSGEKGLIVDRQTQEWAWRLDIRNAGTSAIRVRLEEPLPQPRDERIKITFQLDPEANEKSSSEMIWRMEIPEGQKRSLFTTIRLEAPKEMDLDLGWRR
ncbi:MAG: mucoidy inhibitor MuiA family protein [Deltaproteobacteria bacterium]|nr:mucoidy inhibitor MuiA family protein [Deltaproteobacteria bacterium]